MIVCISVQAILVIWNGTYFPPILFFLGSKYRLYLALGRYVTAGSAWLNGAFGKVAKAGQVAGTKTRAKWNMAVSNLTAKVGVV